MKTIRTVRIQIVATARKMKRRSRCGMTLIALLLIGLGNAVGAQDSYFPNNATINYNIANNAIVGYDNATDYNNSANGTSPTVNLVSGGSIGSFLYGFNGSKINMSGGNVGDSVICSDNSLLSLTGGAIQYEVYANDSSTVNIIGGSIGDSVFGFNGSTINVSGGSIAGSLYAGDSSTINLFGMGLGSTLIDPNYQDAYSEYNLSGSLLDGTALNGMSLFVQNGTGAQVTLTNFTAVPESGSVVLLAWLGLTGATLLRRKRAG